MPNSIDKVIFFVNTPENGILDVKESIKNVLNQTLGATAGEVTVTANFPVDIIVIDPQGRRTDKSVAGIPGSTYFEEDVDGDGEDEYKIVIKEGIDGNYSIIVTPETNAYPLATYSLDATIKTIVIHLSEDITIPQVEGNDSISFGNLPPTIYPKRIGYANIGNVYTYSAYAEDPEDEVLTYQAVNLPDGMMFDSKDGTITWLPNESQLGDH